MLRLLAAGKFDQRIATTWRRSNGQKHVTHALGKLGAAGRTEAGTARASGPWSPDTAPQPTPVTPSGDRSPRSDIPPGGHLWVTPHAGGSSYLSRRAGLPTY